MTQPEPILELPRQPEIVTRGPGLRDRWRDRRARKFDGFDEERAELRSRAAYLDGQIRYFSAEAHPSDAPGDVLALRREVEAKEAEENAWLQHWLGKGPRPSCDPYEPGLRG